jgi:hypothetical protein
MIKTIDTSSAAWEVHPGDDPRFVSCAEKLVAAAAALGAQRDIVVVRIDNWFGLRWLRFPNRQYRGRWRPLGGRPHGVLTVKKLREPACFIPPFHPHRVLSEERFELHENGVVQGPFEPREPLHRMYTPKMKRERTFDEACEPGIYAWCSGNTKANDRAALMVYTHAIDGTSAWYAEFRRVDYWRVSRHVPIGNADWCRLLETGGVTQFE